MFLNINVDSTYNGWNLCKKHWKWKCRTHILQANQQSEAAIVKLKKETVNAFVLLRHAYFDGNSLMYDWIKVAPAQQGDADLHPVFPNGCKKIKKTQVQEFFPP